MIAKLQKDVRFWAVIYFAFYFIFLFLYRIRSFGVDLSVSIIELYSKAIIIAWVGFGIFLQIVIFKNVNFSKAEFKQIIFYGIIFNIFLLPLLPLTSTDLFNYIARGRIISIYSENPYLVPYSLFQDDAFYFSLETVWSSNTLIYGPFFVVLSGFLTAIMKENLIAPIYLFKLLFLVINIANSYLIYRITFSKKSTLLYAWNPFILYEFSLDAHNDSLLIFFVLLSLLIIRNTNITGKVLSFGLITLSFLIKLFSILFAPFYLIYLYYQQKKLALSYYVVFLSLLLGGTLIILFYYPFLESFYIFRRLFEVLDETTIFASPFVVFSYSILKKLGVFDYYYWGKLLSKFMFIALYILLIKRFYETKKKDFINFVNILIVVLGTFYLTALNWFMPWYLIFLISLMIIYFGLTDDYKYVYFIFGLSFLGIILNFPTSY